jgi:uncharacterized protein YgbK (DUF1537 family)
MRIAIIGQQNHTPTKPKNDMSETNKVGLIADDFTGAMDTGAQFAKYGFDTSFALSSVPNSRVVALNTASREIHPDEARDRCRQAVRKLQGRSLFKKIDSVLRGHIGAELDGLVSESPYSKIVVCPISPHQGHVVRNGFLYVRDRLVHESFFKNDPAFPARTSSVAELVGVPSSHLALETVRRPVQELASAISATPTAVVTVDAIDAGDLHHLSRAISLNDFLPCGGIGLANAWAQVLIPGEPVQNQTTFPHLEGPLMIVAGSASIKTREQIAALANHPESLVWKINVPLNPAEKEAWFGTIQSSWSEAPVVVLCPGLQTTVRDPEWLNFHQTVSCLAAELLERFQPAAILIVGGETANHCCRLLEVQAVRLSGETQPGIPFGKVVGGRADQMILLTKAGGNGQPDCLEKIVYR